MTLKKFATEIEKLGGTVDLKGEEFNTNNAWGFGGAIGKSHKVSVKGQVVYFRKGRACFRHLPCEPFTNVRDKGGMRHEPKDFLQSLKA